MIDCLARSYILQGSGFCLHLDSGKCRRRANKCYVNGYQKKNSTDSECRAMCDSDSACIGYAIAAASYLDAPGLCYVHTTARHTGEFEIPSGWEAFDQDHFSIGATTGDENVSCYMYSYHPVCSGVMGSQIRVDQNGNGQPLNIMELTVNGGTQVTAEVSKAHASHPAFNCVDGDTETMCRSDGDPWWATFTLQQTTCIRRIDILKIAFHLAQ